MWPLRPVDKADAFQLRSVEGKVVFLAEKITTIDPGGSRKPSNSLYSDRNPPKGWRR